VLAIWLTAALFGRDIVSLASVQHPREAGRGTRIGHWGSKHPLSGVF
jgi:NADH dehydrogenase